MDKRILIGIVIFIIAGFVIWRFLLPALQSISTNKALQDNSNVTATPSALVNLQVPESSTQILGVSILMSPTYVKDVINKKAFWVGSLNEDKNLMVVNSDDVSIEVGDIVSVSGVVRNIKDAPEEIRGNLSEEDISIIKNNPVYIAGERVEIIE